MTSSQQADLAATSLDGAVKQLLLVLLAPRRCRRMYSLLMDVLQAAREALVEKVVTGIIANSKNEFYYFNKVLACVCCMRWGQNSSSNVNNSEGMGTNKLSQLATLYLIHWYRERPMAKEGSIHMICECSQHSQCQ